MLGIADNLTFHVQHLEPKGNFSVRVICSTNIGFHQVAGTHPYQQLRRKLALLGVIGRNRDRRANNAGSGYFKRYLWIGLVKVLSESGRGSIFGASDAGFLRSKDPGLGTQETIWSPGPGTPNVSRGYRTHFWTLGSVPPCIQNN